MDFLSADYMPHGQCYLWQPHLLFSHVISDLVIAGSYFSIPMAIVWFLSQRKDIKFQSVFYLFAAFILMCGITHLFSVYVIWVGQYGVQAILKGITAAVSFATALAVYYYLPAALSLPSRAQWERLKREAFEKRQEEESQSFFQTITDSMSSGLIVADQNLNVVLANPLANRIFGREDVSLKNRSISDFIPKSVSHHQTLANQFFKLPSEFQHPMAKGRQVKAIRDDGREIEVQVKLSQFNYFDQTMVAVTIDADGMTHDSHQEEQYGRTMRSLDSVNDGAWEWNIKTNEVWWNTRHAELIGVDANEAPSFATWESHIHPAERDRVLNYLDETVKARSEYNIEYLGKADNGSYQWFRSRGKVYTENDEPIYMTGMLSNVQDTHELRTELNEKTEFLNRLIDRSVAGLYVFDFTKNKNTYINQTYTQQLGYTLDDLNEIDNLLSLFHPDEAESVLAHMEDVRQEPSKAHELIYRFKHKNGHWVWCMSQDSVNDVNEKGEPASMLGTFIDITDLKEKEQSIQEWAASFYSIFNQAAVGIAQVALDGSFMRVNQRVCEMWGYRENELLSKTFQDLTHPDDLDIDLQNVQALINGDGESYTLEKRYLCSTGRIFWALLTVKIVRDNQNKPLHFISVIEDIDAIKETERALNESNQALEAFAFTASHDLQEPLRKIRTFAGLIEDRLTQKFEDPDARYELNRLTDAAERMSRLISSVLDLARVSKSKLDVQSVSISDIWNAAVSSLEIQPQRDNIRWEFETDARVDADAEQLNRVFQNIITNARKYQSPEKESVLTIDTTSDQDWIVISISDNGPGVAFENAEQIFAPFKRLVGKDIDGSGMGLAICRQIINKHGGSIYADTSYTNGLKLLIRLPKVRIE